VPRSTNEFMGEGIGVVLVGSGLGGLVIFGLNSKVSSGGLY